MAGPALARVAYPHHLAQGSTSVLESDMEGVYLKFYVSEFREHNGILLFEWLL